MSNVDLQQATVNVVEEQIKIESTCSRWFRWSQNSLEKLVEAETKLLSNVKSHIVSRFVNIDLFNSTLRTITVMPKSHSPIQEVPFVLIHGFAAGVGFWAGNLDEMASKRTVHAFDLLGFGRSSRPSFSKIPEEAEQEFVRSIEEWRQEMGIEKMVLVGHSFGAYLSSSYSLQHPERVRHLVLVDPWGFNEKPLNFETRLPLWARAIGGVMTRFSPLVGLRAAGPWGPSLVRRIRADLGVRYSHIDSAAIFDYIYHCNSQKPSGELAFASLTHSIGWARSPMSQRFHTLHNDVPVTFIHGDKSWIQMDSAIEIQENRTGSYVNVVTVEDAGHHIYADQPKLFNEILASLSDLIDKDHDKEPINVTTARKTNSSTE